MLGKFTLRHRTTLLCAKFVKIVRREIGEIVRDLTDHKNEISAPSQTVATARIALKACHGQPQQLAHNVPNFIQIGSHSAEL